MRAATLFAVDPSGTGGVLLRSRPGPVRDRWLERLRASLPEASALRRIPLHVTDGRLVGGLDLAATLRTGRPVEERGLLAEADGGVVLLAMAERLSAGVAARLGHVLDVGEVVLERDGLGRRHATQFGVVALDEGLSEEEQPPAALRDRLAFHLDLTPIALALALDSLSDRIADRIPDPDAAAIAAARARLPGIQTGADTIEALCEAAMTLGIDSMRAPQLALRVARAAAAWAARDAIEEEDLTLAVRLVLAPRATCWPLDESSSSDVPDQLDAPPSETDVPPEESRAEPPDSSPAEEGDASQSDRDSQASPSNEEGTNEEGTLAEKVLAAAAAAMPQDLLAQLRLAEGARPRSGQTGKSGARRASTRRGRPIGARRGDPSEGARLNVVETLRAAAPWQRLRRAARGPIANEQNEPAGPPRRSRPTRLEIRRDDFRVNRFRERSETTTLFVVDASGSAALHRLAEAKGAVELLLAESYVRRDRVALIAFKGRAAELVLPPTRSLARAKRSLAALPGGGGTPLAAAIEAAVEVAQTVLRAGGTPLVVFLTDGQANVARDGTGGRARAAEEARMAARLFRSAGLGALWVDTSPRPRDAARELAREMQASYLPLPQADSGALFEATRNASARGARASRSS